MKYSEIALPQFDGLVMKNVDLSKHCTWQIGGSADLFITCDSQDDLMNAVNIAETHDIPWLVIGTGANILFSDKGYRGIIIQLGSSFNQLEFVAKDKILAGAAVKMSRLSVFAQNNGLSGLEPLCGIPGTVGAAAFINAGAFNTNFLDFAEKIHFFNKSGIPQTSKDFSSNYRSGFLKPDDIVCGVELKLESKSRLLIQTKMESFLSRRKQTQPLEWPSAGCTFKNPQGSGAGRLIDKSGLKGFRIGDAEISTKHANFIINRGKATAADIHELIRVVRQKIREQHGIELILEVTIVDEFGQPLNPGCIL